MWISPRGNGVRPRFGRKMCAPDPLPPEAAMPRRTHTAVLAGLAGLLSLGLTACGGSVDGSAHAVAPAVATAAPTSDATTPTPVPAVTPAPAAPVPAPNAAGAAAAGGSGGGSAGGGSGGQGSAPAPSAPAPKITSFRVVQQPSCPVHGTPDAPFSKPGSAVVIAWSVSGAKGAAIAVDNPDVYGAYGSDYPASDKLSLPFGCDSQGTTTHRYTVWPAGAKNVSRTISASAHSDG
jgi:hypothetical protein